MYYKSNRCQACRLPAMSACFAYMKLLVVLLDSLLGLGILGKLSIFQEFSNDMVVIIAHVLVHTTAWSHCDGQTEICNVVLWESLGKVSRYPQFIV